MEKEVPLLFAPQKILLKNHQEILLRPAEKSEASQVLQVFAELAKTSPYILMTPEAVQAMTVEDEEKWIEQSNVHPASLFLLAESESEIIGLGSFAGFKDTKRKHRGTLGLTIRPDFHGKGLGTHIMKFLIQAAKSMKSIQSIELSVMEPNHSAFHIYQKLGFKEVGRVPQAFLLKDGSFADDILMQLWVGASR
jgi:RimJ/RimL family protein N-acetyltransferase